MTLTELIEDEFSELDYDTVEICKKVALSYAREIIPEKRKIYEDELVVGSNLCNSNFNDCRTQMLSRIEEDSK